MPLARDSDLSRSGSRAPGGTPSNWFIAELTMTCPTVHTAPRACNTRVFSLDGRRQVPSGLRRRTPPPGVHALLIFTISMVETGAACPHTSSKGAQRELRPRRPRATTATGRSRRGRSRRSSRTWLSTSARPVPRTRTAAARRPSSRPRTPRPSSRRAPRAAPRASRPELPSCACGARGRPCPLLAARARGSVWTATGEFRVDGVRRTRSYRRRERRRLKISDAADGPLRRSRPY